MKPPTFTYQKSVLRRYEKQQAETLIKQLSPRIFVHIFTLLGPNHKIFWIRNMSIKPDYMPDDDDFTFEEKDIIRLALQVIHSSETLLYDLVDSSGSFRIEKLIGTLTGLEAIINSARYKEFRCHHALIT